MALVEIGSGLVCPLAPDRGPLSRIKENSPTRRSLLLFPGCISVSMSGPATSSVCARGLSYDARPTLYRTLADLAGRDRRQRVLRPINVIKAGGLRGQHLELGTVRILPLS